MLVHSNIFIRPASGLPTDPAGFQMVATMRYQGKMDHGKNGAVIRTIEPNGESDMASLETFQQFVTRLGNTSEVFFFTASERAELARGDTKTLDTITGVKPEDRVTYHPLFPVGADWTKVLVVVGFNLTA